MKEYIYIYIFYTLLNVSQLDCAVKQLFLEARIIIGITLLLIIIRTLHNNVNICNHMIIK